MNVELKVTSPTPVITWTNTYVLDVKYMHGDANAYSHEINYYDSIEAEGISALHMHLKGLHFMQHQMTKHTDGAYQKQFIIAFFENLGYPTEENDEEDSDMDMDGVLHPDVEEFLELYMQRDTTDDSYEYNAIVTDVKVYYYDEVGKKFNVDITITKDTNED